MTAEQRSKVEQICVLTGLPPDVAEDLLRGTNWNVELSAESIFGDSSGAAGGAVAALPQQQPGFEADAVRGVIMSKVECIGGGGGGGYGSTSNIYHGASHRSMPQLHSALRDFELERIGERYMWRL